MTAAPTRARRSPRTPVRARAPGSPLPRLDKRPGRRRLPRTESSPPLAARLLLAFRRLGLVPGPDSEQVMKRARARAAERRFASRQRRGLERGGADHLAVARASRGHRRRLTLVDLRPQALEHAL